MQKRFPHSRHQTYEAAKNAKLDLIKETGKDEHTFQVRKKANGFVLMERLPTKEAKVIKDMRNGPRKNH